MGCYMTVQKFILDLFFLFEEKTVLVPVRDRLSHMAILLSLSPLRFLFIVYALVHGRVCIFQATGRRFCINILSMYIKKGKCFSMYK